MGFPLETETPLLRIAQEALTNIRKHAQATRAWLQVEKDDQEVSFIMGDNGRGFDPNSTRQQPGQRFGLQIMPERAEQVGGQLAVVSGVGQGTLVVVSLPEAALESR